MTEFQELIQDAPNFVSMERGELVAYAYGMFAAGTKANAENAKLLELAKRMARALGVGSNLCDRNCGWEFECDMVSCPIEKAMRELGIEVD